MKEPKITEKRWSREREHEIVERWKKDKIYAFKESKAKKVYSIDTPPPYVNTPVHIGQATTYVLMDMFARFKRMTGWNVLFPLGLDRNGLPIELATEKKFNIKLTDMKREEFLEKCQKVLEESSLSSMNSFLYLGIGFNSWTIGTGLGEIYLTDSEDYRALTQATFIDLWHKGLIYEDERINNYCPGCQTTLADAEIEYKDINSFFNDLKFKVKETGEEIVIGTTRPELVCTCGMVIFNPEDERYKHLNGMTAITPLFGKEVPIKAHPLAEKEKGTGLAMMCSAGDLSDIRFFREEGLEPVIAINQDGRMNEHAGFLKGLRVREARKKMVEALKEKGLLVKQQQIMHRTPVCERSGDEIEFIAMKEFYLKQLHLKDEMKAAAEKMNFFAPQSRQILLNWIDSVSIDWPISRRRYYATEIPLWYCGKCGETIVPPKGKYYRPWKEKPPVKKCQCGGTDFKGETRVFDTWFDSSNTPLYVLKYGRNEKFFQANKPCSLRPQGKEIIRTWLYYTVLKDYLLTNEVIFNDVWINFHIVDEKGKKMSKRTGNVINPEDILKQFGAEPFRMWSAAEGNLVKTDFRCSFERIQGAGKTITKLWNTARFISMFEKPKKEPKQLMELDKWIIAETERLAEETGRGFEDYDFHNPVVELRHFVWETFASHYLELVKARAYNSDNAFSKEEQASALYTLHYCLETLLKMLAPVLPLITFDLYQKLTGKDVHFEAFPKAEKKVKAKVSREALMELNGQVWKAKKDKGESLKAEVKELILPSTFKPFEADLKAAHSVQKLSYGEKLSVKL